MMRIIRDDVLRDEITSPTDAFIVFEYPEGAKLAKEFLKQRDKKRCCGAIKNKH